MRNREPSGRGLTDRKICLAVAVGIIGGVAFGLARHRPYSFTLDDGSEFTSSLSTNPNFAEQLQTKINVVETERNKLKTKYESTLREVEELTTENEKLKKLQLMAVSERDAVARQLKDAGVQAKVGPPGTMRSARTNPTVIADRSTNRELGKILDEIAINNEVIVAVSNNYIRDMLRTWFENVKRAGITNFIVVALDDQVAEFCRDNKVPVYRRDAKIPHAQKDTGDNHAISGLKFHLLREFLQLGYSVLLSDVDIVFLQNPFDHLIRDSDVESMTDGFDEVTAFGWDDVMDDASMGWARYAHTMRIFVFNSGLFYIRPTVPAIELLDRVTARLAKEKAWDQAVFNEELFFPSHPGYDGLHASKRVMDYKKFMNSKFLFKILRKTPEIHTIKPVSIHVNYHPDKHERMLAIVQKWVHGKDDALDRFPDGSSD